MAENKGKAMVCKSWNLVVAALLPVLAVFAGCANKPALPLVEPQKAYIDASSTLRQAADDSDAVTRANALEALSQIYGLEAGAVFKQALDDTYPTVRFAAGMAIGDVLYQPAKPTLVAMAQQKEESQRAEPDKRVFCAVIYALHRLGDDSFTGELGSLLSDDEKEVRANAAMVMGRLGERSAIVPLRVQLSDEQDTSVQLQIVESLALLGDTANAIRLEAYTKTQFLEDRLVAISAMERVRSSRSAWVLQDLLVARQPPRVRVAAAGALARLGQTDEKWYKLCLSAVQQPDRMVREGSGKRDDASAIEVNSLQRLAVISLGWMNRQDAVDVLHPLLRSGDGGVRVAAAMSILRLLEAYRPIARQPVAKPEPSSQPATTQPAAERKVLPKLYTAEGKD